ncbi:MAG: cytochrome c oxidase subunit II [Rhodovulum sp.]|nr:cytochrome c oxidase subunit II [Rhodovulum sp.]|tara:strand:- start:3890 stop:4708 length:819 start_codon:yes stop_codon:yes gene_type:complete
MLSDIFKAVSILWGNEGLYESTSTFIQEGKLFMQDGYTPIMEGITNLHNDIMFFIFVILGFVCWMLFITVYIFRVSSNERPTNVTHGTLIEVIWTVTPTLILLVIALPTFALLYSMDEGIEPEITVKAIGHQWYWSYEYSDFYGSMDANSTLSESDGGHVAFDSFMVNDADFDDWSQLRLLEVDNPLILPVDTHIRMLVTSADVLHSWAVPSLGVKMDAVPGRLNQLSMFINHTGTFYGQCSEICGTNHGFMPIKILAVTRSQYLNWWFLVW